MDDSRAPSTLLRLSCEHLRLVRDIRPSEVPNHVFCGKCKAGVQVISWINSNPVRDRAGSIR